MRKRPLHATRLQRLQATHNLMRNDMPESWQKSSMITFGRLHDPSYYYQQAVLLARLAKMNTSFRTSDLPLQFVHADLLFRNACVTLADKGAKYLSSARVSREVSLKNRRLHSKATGMGICSLQGRVSFEFPAEADLAPSPGFFCVPPGAPGWLLWRLKEGHFRRVQQTPHDMPEQGI